MPFRVLFAIDPGANGAVAVFHDGELHRVFRLPKAEGGICCSKLAMTLRDEIRDTPGAWYSAVLEHAPPMPAKRGEKRGAASAGQFMRTIGKIEGVLGALGLAVRLTYPHAWKKHHGLISQEKSESRVVAQRRWPWLDLTTQNSVDLAEACLIGAWHLETTPL